MRLSWNEVRARAAAFADTWRDAAYEKGETQSFYNAFFRVFGVQRRSVARYEVRVAKLDNRSGFIDLFWPGVLLVEQKSVGRDLKAAYAQARAYCDALPERERPRFILVSDFQTFELHDLDEREVVTFPLAALPTHVEAFGFILGVQRRTFRDQDPANVEAAELVGRLHDALAAAGHRGHDLERFLAGSPPLWRCSRVSSRRRALDSGLAGRIADGVEVSSSRAGVPDRGSPCSGEEQAEEHVGDCRLPDAVQCGIPPAPFLVIPEVSSERREYVPIGWLEPPIIPSNLVRILEHATLADFGLLTSAMHMAWLRHIGG